MENRYATKDNADDYICDRINFSSVMFLAPEFVTREQFPNAEGQSVVDLVTVSYAIASLI